MNGTSRWKWRFAGELAKAALGDRPEERFAGAVTVKANARRKVLTDGKFFFKIETGRGRGFAAEFRRGIALEKSGIPVVQHLAYGLSREGGALITLAEPGAVDAGEYLLQHPVPGEEFTRPLAEFTGMLCSSSFFHGDLHLGNLLWLEGEKSFKLVDVRAVRRMPELFKALKLLRMYRLPLELRTRLPRRELLKLLEISGVRDPERTFKRILRREAAALRREWPRRAAQILEGYPKFSRIDGGMLIKSRCTPEELAAAVSEEGSVKHLQASVFLDIARIPHRQVLACDSASGRIFTAPVSDSGEVAAEHLEDYMERLATAGFVTVPGQWERDPAGISGTPRLKDIDVIAQGI